MLLLRPLIRYADFGGRARRAEYWLFVAFQAGALLLSMVMAAASLPKAFNGGDGSGLLLWSGLFVLLIVGLIVPYLAVLVRRLHDIGRTGWWALLLVPIQASGPLASIAAARAVAQGADGPLGVASFQPVMASAAASMIPFVVIASICSMVLFVMTLAPGMRGPNRYGPNPRGPDQDVPDTDAPYGGSYDNDRLEAAFAEALAARAAPEPERPRSDWGHPALVGDPPARTFGRRAG